MDYKIQGQVFPLSGLPEVLISFSVTLSHSVASCREVNPTSQGVCISSRSCTRYSLVTGRPAAAGNRTPVCCVGGENGNHLTTRPTSWTASLKMITLTHFLKFVTTFCFPYYALKIAKKLISYAICGS